MTNSDLYKIPLEKLKRICKCDVELDFCDTSLDVASFDEVIGQERGVHAMQFGLTMDAPGYNIFVAGPQGTGKNSYAQEIVSKVALKRPKAYDWCYINNFGNQDQPLSVSVPAGQGRIFQKDMELLVADLKVVIPKSFESSVYEQKKDSIIQAVQKKMEELFKNIEIEAHKIGYNVEQIPPRVVFIPVRNGKPLPREEYEKLSAEERNKIDENGRKLGKKLDEVLHEGQLLEKQANGEIVELEKSIAYSAAESQISKLKEKYEKFPKIVQYLESVLIDVEENHIIFNSADVPMNQRTFPYAEEESDQFLRYRVNLFINNEKSEGAPVVFEPSPYYYNIFGKIEYKSQILAVSTDFTMIKPGAIHAANGGYLIMQINDVLMDPFSWDTLKKALKYRQAVVENIGEQYRLVPTVGLKPEAIPLNVKIILIGSPIIFELLYSLDEDFKKLFKVKVDFDVDMQRNPENLSKYISFVSKLCQKENMKSFSRSGIGRIIEYSSRLAGDQNKLSTRFNVMTDIIYEAAAMAVKEGSEFVDAHHVDEAIKEQKHRDNKIEEKIQEEILQENILVRTEGSEIGQINGLSILEVGGYIFGIPSRITARTYIGNDGIINIERETEMSGNIHSKGVLTLAGYLGGKFGQKKPLGLTAQITFEQNYEGIEGDSASSTELYAILSSLSGVPLRQSLAVTGSVDQLGTIQPIGGVNQKIEGFFDICSKKGLSGEQGVIIPAQNINNLMLKDEVLNAVKENKFQIYAIKNIEEGIEILSGVPAGKIGDDGKYPESSIFYKVEKKLQEYNKGIFSLNMESKKLKKK